MPQKQKKKKTSKNVVPYYLSSLFSYESSHILSENESTLLLLAASDSEAAFLSSPHIISSLYPYFKEKYPSIISIQIIYSPALFSVKSNFTSFISIK